MGEKNKRLEGQLPLPVESGEPPTTALLNWWEETGKACVDLALMMRRPTDQRPFVYELRIDLFPVRAAACFMVAKGFGEDGPLVSFHDGAGFVDTLRAFEARMRSGSTRWRADNWRADSYDKRVALYLKSLEDAPGG